MQQQNFEVTEIICLQKLLNKLHLPHNNTCKLFYDNKASINRHFIKEELEKKIISLTFVRSKDYLADLLIKVVSSKTFEQTLCKSDIVDLKI